MQNSEKYKYIYLNIATHMTMASSLVVSENLRLSGGALAWMLHLPLATRRVVEGREDYQSQFQRAEN